MTPGKVCKKRFCDDASSGVICSDLSCSRKGRCARAQHVLMKDDNVSHDGASCIERGNILSGNSFYGLEVDEGETVQVDDYPKNVDVEKSGIFV